MAKFTQIPTDTFKKLQLNAGILTTEFDPATTAERWRLLEAIERSRSPGRAGVSGGGRNATLGSVAREPQRERRCASRGSRP